MPQEPVVSILKLFCSYQKNRDKILYYDLVDNVIWGNVVGKETLEFIQDELEKDGLIKVTSEGSVYLVNWEELIK